MWGGYFGPHKKRVWLLLLLLLLSSVLFLATEATATRLYTHGSQGQLQKLLHASLESSKESVGGERHRDAVNGGEIKESNTPGSRPPSCEHKCGGCVPCLAIQVPTAMDRIELHYSNYEPEGWKCKCGSTFFNP